MHNFKGQSSKRGLLNATHNPQRIDRGAEGVVPWAELNASRALE
jgi:hypothetical protein